VSIGFPVYNGERYLCEAMDSLLTQTFEDFEIVISDNASTDRTEEICRSFAAQDRRVRYVRQPANRGGAWNLNAVFAMATGVYFKWAAHDDLCKPTFLERCVETLDQLPSVVLSYPRTIIIDEDSKIIEYYDVCVRTGSRHANIRFLDLIRVYHGCYQVNGLIRAAALRRSPLIGNYAAADRVLLARLSLLGPFYEVPEYLFLSRRHKAQSVSSSRFARTAWFDPTKRGRIVFPEWRLFREHFTCLRDTPLSANERALCMFHALCWPLWNRNWRGMMIDLVRAGQMALLARGALAARCGKGWLRRGSLRKGG
jgi:glycosyltransferase involved in cell wall biosynthesis